MQCPGNAQLSMHHVAAASGRLAMAVETVEHRHLVAGEQNGGSDLHAVAGHAAHHHDRRRALIIQTDN